MPLLNQKQAIIRRLRKISTVGFDELRVRGYQAFVARLERLGWSATSVSPSKIDLASIVLFPEAGISAAAELFLHQLRGEGPTRFFEGLTDPAATAAEILRRWPWVQRDLVGKAERVLEGRMDLLGFSDLQFGNPINWHFDPISKIQTPRRHWSTIDYLDPEVAGDKKIIWELNRHQHFVTLGRAYSISGDERYTAEFQRQLCQWMEENPPKTGINWVSSLEVAFRTISWIWALNYFSRSPVLRSSTLESALKFFYLNGIHLETFLSTYFSPNTHLTGEALGLFYLGTQLPQLRPASRWRTLGATILLSALERQVGEDGVYFEPSTYYHRYTADIYTHFFILARLNNEDYIDRVGSKLRGLLDFLMYISSPDGSTPLIGDDDGGQLLPLTERSAGDFSGALFTGAALFGRGDYKFVALNPAEELLWLLGKSGAEKLDSVQAAAPQQTSQGFPESGYFVMRDGWSNASNYALVRCGSADRQNNAHAHADALSMVVAIQGHTILVDPGTYTYTGSDEQRNHFRSSEAHNTLTVDGQSSSVPAGPFAWKSVAGCNLHSWIAESRFDFFFGAQGGYGRLRDPVEHARQILHLKNDYFVIRDNVGAKDQHSYCANFHFHPDLTVLPPVNDAGGPVRIRKQGYGEVGALYSFGDGGSWSFNESKYSAKYGNLKSSKVGKFSSLTTGKNEIVTFIIPTGATSITSQRCHEGSAFQVSIGDARDVLLVASGTEPEALSHGAVSAEAVMVWLRFGHASNQLIEFIIVNGTYLYESGDELWRSKNGISCKWIRRVRSFTNNQSLGFN
jgi:hypothetical protein